MRKSVWVTTAALCAVATAALLSGANAKGQVAQSKPGTSTGTSKTTSPYERVLLRPALLTAQAPATYEVKFTTTKGDFTIKVTREWSPHGADRFYNLVRHHFYDHAAFFRVLKGFVVQWGISAYPPVSAAWSHAPIKDDPVKQSNQRGYVTYAQTDKPDTRTTQVFINLRDNKQLDDLRFAPFGEVTEGMDVVESLYSGYGEGAPDGQGPEQDKIEKLGKSYLDKDFAQLDSITTTKLILPEGAVPAQKPAAKPATPSGK